MGWASRAAVLLLMLGAAACGSGDDGGDGASDTESEELTPEEVATDPTALSPEQWTDDASGACMDWAGLSLAVEGTDAQAATELADLARAFADELDEIAQPIDITEEATAFVEAVAELADEYDALAEELEAGGSADDDTLVGSPAAYDELRELAQELAERGLDCRPDSTPEDENEGPAGGIEGEGTDPREVVDDFGSDTELSNLAFVCYSGDFERCDELADEAPDSDADDSFQHYGATCGDRLAGPQPGECEALAG
jgi:hypothetical protein